MGVNNVKSGKHSVFSRQQNSFDLSAGDKDTGLDGLRIEIRKNKKAAISRGLRNKIRTLVSAYFAGVVPGAAVAGGLVVVAGLVPAGLEPSEPLGLPAGLCGAGTPDCVL